MSSITNHIFLQTHPSHVKSDIWRRTAPAIAISQYRYSIDTYTNTRYRYKCNTCGSIRYWTLPVIQVRISLSRIYYINTYACFSNLVIFQTKFNLTLLCCNVIFSISSSHYFLVYLARRYKIMLPRSHQCVRNMSK